MLPRYRLVSHLRDFYANAGKGVKAAGFKLMMSQARHRPAIFPLLLDLGVKFLFLYRRDTFATALSYYRAQRTQVFHSDREPTHGNRLLGPANAAEVREFYLRCLSDKEEILETQRSIGGLLLAYEDMVANWDRFIFVIGREIGVPELRVGMALAKLGGKVSTSRFSNEDELRGELATLGIRKS
jgi:LPS sulfotransferase NodH